MYELLRCVVRLFILILTGLISACAGPQKSSPINKLEPTQQAPKDVKLFCSPEWFRYVESQVISSDHLGHGPDLASEEWQSVVEFKLGLQANSNVPLKNTPQWCQFIQQQLDAQRIPPTFSCQAKSLNIIEKEICQDQGLSNLDLKMNAVFEEVLDSVALDESRVLKAEQRGWIKGRDDCWKSQNRQRCITQVYQYRIAELQARYQLIDPLGPIFYVCDGRPLDEIVVTFFSTVPPSILAERAGHVSFMLLQETASGSKYQGRNETFWEHQGQARVTWGVDATEMNCEEMH